MPESSSGRFGQDGAYVVVRHARDHAARVPVHETFHVHVDQDGVLEMEEMVRGRSAVPEPARHAAAMAERERRDFHQEFATYRFRPLSEHGAWAGRTGIVASSGA